MASIDLNRVIDKLEAHFAHHDLVGAERLLLYWRGEAEAIGDRRGVNQIDNELVGLYRRTNEKEKALSVADRLLPQLAPDNVGDATIRLNLATNYCHFGQPERARPLYAEAEAVLVRHLAPNDYRLSSLYNNMASYYIAVGNLAEAEKTYEKALDVMRQIEPRMPEMAVTYVNLATAIYRQSPLSDRVDACMMAAYEVLQDPTIAHDGNYAFVLSKVIPLYVHLGYKKETASLENLLKDTEENV